jgi:hypothetical protein
MIATLFGEYLFCCLIAFALTLVVMVAIAAERIFWFGVWLARDLAIAGANPLKRTWTRGRARTEAPLS